MYTPPNPGVPALLLAAAARLGFRITTRTITGSELGVLIDGTTDKTLIVAGAGDGRVEWQIAERPPGFAPHLMSRATYDILREGSLTSDGSVSWHGRRYLIRSWYDDARFIAEAVAVEAVAA